MSEKRGTRHGSQQREAIFQYVAAQETHPTADQIFAGVRRDWPSLGLATVYRNLSALVEEGRLSYSMHEGIARYDARTDAHHHFTCRECGVVQNVDFELPDALMRTAQRKVGGKVESISVDLTGLCSGCR